MEGLVPSGDDNRRRTEIIRKQERAVLDFRSTKGFVFSDVLHKMYAL